MTAPWAAIISATIMRSISSRGAMPTSPRAIAASLGRVAAPGVSSVELLGAVPFGAAPSGFEPMVSSRSNCCIRS
jgi:hypothetical protein